MVICKLMFCKLFLKLISYECELFITRFVSLCCYYYCCCLIYVKGENDCFLCTDCGECVITCRNTSYCGLLSKIMHKNRRKHEKKIENLTNLCIAYYKETLSLFYRKIIGKKKQSLAIERYTGRRVQPTRRRTIKLDDLMY